MGREIAAVDTPMAEDEVATAFKSYLGVKYPNGGMSCNALPILLAHSAFETGAWKKLVCYNFGNFKKLSTADYCFFTCTEWVPLTVGEQAVAASTAELPCEEIERTDTKMHLRLKSKHPGACFAAFSSSAGGAESYLESLRSRFSLAWAAAMVGDVVKFVHSLKERGYFTADEGEYLRGVSGFLNQWGIPRLVTDDDLLHAIPPLLEPVEADDPITERGIVLQFQTARGLLADGVAGALTKNQIRIDTENLQNSRD